MDSGDTLRILFTCLITLQFAVIVSHDWVDVPGWTYGSQVQAVMGRGKLRLATLVNAIFPALAVAFALYFWNRPEPKLAADYSVVYCGVTVALAIAMWYIPYFRGAAENTKRDYAIMYAGTRQVLPPRGDNPRPNLLHLSLHVLFAINFLLSLALRFQS
jgi:hypothetical protein